ncbi:MAG: solute carrier family 26 protein [Haliscomenobacter sp.]|nr:solute carrier family 26 protein [Haliscomenobacter sp.]MBP9873330.1 solute carrier family 26 protein [Haliscomenobacter sp.]
MNIKQFIPALEWLPKYTKKQFSGDLSAGLTVGVMLIPQGMAYSMLAGLDPIYGLYAVTLPLMAYAFLGTSRQLAVGPVAMVALLTASGIGGLAEAGSGQYVQLAFGLALLAGVIQLLLGVFRLGFLVNFLSHPVISGFTSAAALIIGLSQLKHLLGISIPNSEHIHEIVLAAAQNIRDTNPYTLALGLGGIALILAVKRIHRAIPGSLLAVLAGILIVWGFGLTGQGVKIVGSVPSGLPSFVAPQLGLPDWQALIPVALTISLVGFMESIAVAKAIQARHRDYKVDANQELIALGAANLFAGFFKAFPVTGGFSRTAVNDQAGAKTGMASFISATLIVLTLLFLTPLFYYLPNAILASVILVAVLGLIDVKEPMHLWKSNKTDFYMLMVTFVATLLVGIEKGIGLGVILSLVMVIYRTTKPHIAVLGQVPGTRTYRNLARFDHLIEKEHLLIYRFDADLYFANVSYFKDSLEELVQQKGAALKAIIINAESVNNLDSSAIHALEEVIDENRKRGFEIAFTGVKGPIRDAMKKAHLIDKIGDNRFFLTIQDAVDACDAHCQRAEAGDYEHQDLAVQTNV